MVLEIDLDKYMEETVVRRYEIEGKLYNIHGEHDTRGQMISEVVFAATDEITKEDEDQSLSFEQFLKIRSVCP